MFKKILVANRGEIACRVIRSAKCLGITCVAVYSDIDANALHVKLADEAYCIGAAPAKDSYLNIAAIINIAKQAKVEAIHPGYGFLSENANFAKECEKEKIVFIGPSAAAIAAMGSKSAAKKLCKQQMFLRFLVIMNELFQSSGKLENKIHLHATIGDKPLTATIIQQNHTLHIFYQDHFILHVQTSAEAEVSAAAILANHLVAPMPGTLTALLVKPEQKVAQGETLAIMEAMKMEHTITAPAPGVIKAIYYKVGDLITEGTELFQFEISA